MKRIYHPQTDSHCCPWHFCYGADLSYAQTEEQIEKFNEEREVYFNEKLELTESEKKAFWPLYNDFNNRKMKLMEEERNTFRYAHKNAENLSDEEIKEILARILKLQGAGIPAGKGVLPG